MSGDSFICPTGEAKPLSPGGSRDAAQHPPGQPPCGELPSCEYKTRLTNQAVRLDPEIGGPSSYLHTPSMVSSLIHLLTLPFLDSFVQQINHVTQFLLD